ncbi:MAG: hypothetical protein Q7R76_00920 [Candidatus Woesearchaeota archaeon]|nr:hypothetical protein [Candidatus Woesearchaeota archaeon]
MELVSAERMRTDRLPRSDAELYARVDALVGPIFKEYDDERERQRAEAAGVVAQAVRADLDHTSALVTKMAEEGRYGSLDAFWKAFQEPKKESKPSAGTSPLTDDISGTILGFSVPTSSPQRPISSVDAFEESFLEPTRDPAIHYHPTLILHLTESSRSEGQTFASELATQSEGSLSSLSVRDPLLFRLDSTYLTHAQFQRLRSYTTAIIDCGTETRVSYDEKRRLVYFDQGKTAPLRQHARRLVGPFVRENDYLLQPKADAPVNELVESAQAAGHVLRAYDPQSGTLVFRDGVSQPPGFLIDNAQRIAPVQSTERYESAWTRMTNTER